MKTKHYIFLMATLLTAQLCHGQGLGGIFNQGQTQNKYLLEQLAALKIYEQYLQQGYKVVKNGTGVIGQIKTGDLGQHTAFFDSLSTVGMRVSHYSKVTDMMRLQQQIITGHAQTYKNVTRSEQMTTAELIAYNNVYEAILKQCESDMDELKLIVSNGKLKMSDDARIGLIDKLFVRMQGYYKHSTAINQQAMELCGQRSRERKDRANLKSLYGQ